MKLRLTFSRVCRVLAEQVLSASIKSQGEGCARTMHWGVVYMNGWVGHAISDRRSDVRSLFIRILALPILLAMLAGCAVNERLPAVPLAAERHVDILGISDARFYADDARKLEVYARKLIARRDQNRSINRVEHYLAISGGADDGAFGAGLLLGWSARGDRPKFDIVTGVSTGALTAPFAFLGKDYDNALKDIYTSITASDIFTMRPLIYAAIMSDGLADTTPLRNLISHYLDQRMMRRLAEEFGKGRILLIGTTNLDQSQGVIWNIGAIAASRHPKARELIIDVLTASASVPGVFPPVMLDVTVNGVPHQEMHVDGGTIAQTFLYPPTLSLSRLDAEAGVRRNRVAYVIRNGRLTPPETTVERSTLPIAAKTLATMIATAGVNDSYQIYLATKRDNVAFNFAHIDDDFNVAYPGPFVPQYMQKLYDYGFQKARNGYRWLKKPPYFAD